MKLHTATILLLFCLSIFTVHTVKGTSHYILLFSLVTLLFILATAASYHELPVPSVIVQTEYLAISITESEEAHRDLQGSASSQSMRKFNCLTLSTKQLNIRSLVSYEKQQVPTDAIMFITAGGIRICVRADQRWVQTAIKRIDERRAAKRK